MILIQAKTVLPGNNFTTHSAFNTLNKPYKVIPFLDMS